MTEERERNRAASSLEDGGRRTKRRSVGASEAEGQGAADEMRRGKGSVRVWFRHFSATQAKGSQGKCTTKPIHDCKELTMALLLSHFSLSDSVRPHRRQPTGLPRPWDSPGKNTGVGCHFLLQCMKVKSESEVAQLCLTLSDHTDCSLPGSPVHGIFQARVLERGAIAFSYDGKTEAKFFKI